MSIYRVSGLALAALLAASPSMGLAETDPQSANAANAAASSGGAQAAQPASDENMASSGTVKGSDSKESIGAGPEGTAGTAATDSWVAEGDINVEEAEGFYPEPPSDDSSQAGTLGLTEGTGEIDTSDLTGSPTGLGAANTAD